jgi:hypothetical protein
MPRGTPEGPERADKRPSSAAAVGFRSAPAPTARRGIVSLKVVQVKFRLSQKRPWRILFATLVILASLEYILHTFIPSDLGSFIAMVVSIAGGVAYVHAEDRAVTARRRKWLARVRGVAFGCSAALFIPSIMSFWTTPSMYWLLLVPPFALAGAWAQSTDLDKNSSSVGKAARLLGRKQR